MRERPIKFSSLGVQRAEGESAVADASRRNHLGIVSTRENLVRLFKILIGESFLHHRYATLAQQPDYPLAGDAGKKCSVGNRREYNAVLRHENIRGGQFGDVAQHIADNRIIEAARLRFKKRAGIVGIEAARFRVYRHRIESWPTIRRQRDGEAFGRAHWGLVD